MRGLPLGGMIGLLLAAFPLGAAAQLLADTLVTWPGYAQPSSCRVQLYAALPGEDRTHVVVIREIAANRGATTVEDARHLAEVVGRRFGFDPAAAYWVFHWGSFSYEGAVANARKQLFLRATFRRLKSQGLGTPQWRILSREQVEDLTDRHFR